MQQDELYNNINLLYSMSYVLQYIRVHRGCTQNKGRAVAQAVSRPAYIPGWYMWDLWKRSSKYVLVFPLYVSLRTLYSSSMCTTYVTLA